MYKEEDSFGLRKLWGLSRVFIANALSLKMLKLPWTLLEISLYAHKEIQQCLFIWGGGVCAWCMGRPVPLSSYLLGIGRGGIILTNVLVLGKLTSSLQSSSYWLYWQKQILLFRELSIYSTPICRNQQHFPPEGLSEIKSYKYVNRSILWSDVTTRGQTCSICSFPFNRFMN